MFTGNSQSKSLYYCGSDSLIPLFDQNMIFEMKYVQYCKFLFTSKC